MYVKCVCTSYSFLHAFFAWKQTDIIINPKIRGYRVCDFKYAIVCVSARILGSKRTNT